MEDLRCYTVHCYFKIIGAKMFNYEDGYVLVTLDEAIRGLDLEDDIKRGNTFAGDYAKFFKVEPQNIIRISRDEYKENVDDDEEENEDEEYEEDEEDID